MIYSATQFEGWIQKVFPTIKDVMDDNFEGLRYRESEILNEDFFQYTLLDLSLDQLNTLISVPGLFHKNRVQQYVSAINFYAKLFYENPSIYISLLVYKRATDLDNPSTLVLNTISINEHYTPLECEEKEEIYLNFEHRHQLDDIYHSDIGYSLALRVDSFLVFKEKYENFISMLNKQLEERTGIVSHSFDPEKFAYYRTLLDMTRI